MSTESTIDLTARTIAYFSMEIALHPTLPTYSGGLGMLAGDTLRSAADTGAPMVAVSLVHRRGYFRQHLDADGQQTESDVPWPPDSLPSAGETITLTMQGRAIRICAWRFDVVGVAGHIIPVFLLDTDVEGNDPFDRRLTDHLYGGDTYYRLCQETVLGLGGVHLLHKLGCLPAVLSHERRPRRLPGTRPARRPPPRRRLASRVHRRGSSRRSQTVRLHHPHPRACRSRYVRRGPDVRRPRPRPRPGTRALRRHAQRPAQHDLRRPALLPLGQRRRHAARQSLPEDVPRLPRRVRHQRRPRRHLDRRAAPAPLRRRDAQLASRQPVLPLRLRHQAQPHRQRPSLRQAQAHRNHSGAHRRSSQRERPHPRFARRVATYKRASLLLEDPKRLAKIAKKIGGLQIVFAGKAHPADTAGKGLIKEVFELAGKIGTSGSLRILYLENYDWELGAILTQGVDVWVNTPRRPYEASGTSGMKAALNGVPSLSILDGWWIEGCAEDVTGWAIDDGDSDAAEATSLYDKLEHKIAPMYSRPNAWARMQQNCIAMNGSFFNTDRMLGQYFANAYFPQAPVSDQTPATQDIAEEAAVLA